MNRSLAPASGIAFAVLVVVGIFLLVGAEIDGMSDQEIVSHYADSGNRTTEIVGFLLVTLGALFFLWFLTTLRSRLASYEPEPRTLFALAFGAGVAASALLVGAAAVLVSTSFAAEITDGFVVDPSLALYSSTSGSLFLLGSVLVNCVLVIATSTLALRTDVLPDWLGWVGFALVVLAVVEALFYPVFAIPVWVLVVSVVLMMRTPTNHPEVQQPDAT